LLGAWTAKPDGAPLSFGESIVEATSVGVASTAAKLTVVASNKIPQVNASPCVWSSVMRRALFDPEECRIFAATCADQADCELDPSNQKVWVDLAQGWLDLAADIEAVEEGRIPSAPVH
jgi:entry exclusion lipoprotein TrbK